MPLLSLLYSTIDCALYFSGRLHTTHALVGSTIFVVGWAVQVGFWTQCDLTTMMEVNGPLDVCYQFYIEKDSSNGEMVGVSNALANAKVAFAYLVLFL